MTTSIIEHLRQQGAHLQDESAPHGSEAGEALMNAADLLERRPIGWAQISCNGRSTYTTDTVKAEQWREWSHLGTVHPVYEKEFNA